MSEYTPTTYEVMNRYYSDKVDRLFPGDEDFSVYKEFDRWLAQHDLEVAQAERARIIALLKTRLDDCYEKNDMGGWSFMPELFIALIEEGNQ